MTRRIISYWLVALLSTSTLALTACGVKGDLETPPPLWGDKAKQDSSQDKTDDTSDDDLSD